MHTCVPLLEEEVLCLCKDSMASSWWGHNCTQEEDLVNHRASEKWCLLRPVWQPRLPSVTPDASRTGKVGLLDRMKQRQTQNADANAQKARCLVRDGFSATTGLLWAGILLCRSLTRPPSAVVCRAATCTTTGTSYHLQAYQGPCICAAKHAYARLSARAQGLSRR